ncbi:tyrosine-type recombinase/integrase [Nitrosomonas eutropha]|uniref:Integrase n=2 Tax=Nitrosomonas eutropha TaxID=916 RepID=A0ABX5M427_9PROT|nr:integrase arm-type DNA-binding domain-containing protein [Nitrosomonas eutropha]ABI59380.1 phage integrase family protein [Nitrosomonas eutropha C91]PXV72107.1 integrase [Nitrosomonas eutropha]
MKLTDSAIRAAKPKEKQYKLTDGNGLTLLIYPDGSKHWRYRYLFNEKESMLSLGKYPETTLAQARSIHDGYKAILKQGINPSTHRKEEKRKAIVSVENSFEAVARTWWMHWKHAKTERHVAYTLRRMEADIFPFIGAKPVNTLTAMHFIELVYKVQSRGALDIAKRVLTMCGQVMRYAVQHGLSERNPAADIKPADILKKRKKVNHKRIPESELPDLLQKINQYDGQPLTRLALQLMTLTFIRTSELIGGRWEEISFDNAEWRIPPERMKMRSQHIVPLSDQAITVLREIKALNSDPVLLFPSERRNGKTMSNNTIIYALYRIGYKGRMTGHGFRGLASTVLHEKNFDHKWIELQLAHAERDEVSAAYNHALYLEQRRKMMQWWGEYIEMKGK